MTVTDTTVQRINPTPWSEVFGYDQAQVRPAPTRLLALAGQGPVDDTGALRHVDDIGGQIDLTLTNIETLLELAGMGWPDVVRLAIYTTDMDGVLAEYARISTRLAAANASPPATLLGVARLALPGMALEIEVTAAQ
ncbi:RidA family protein [Williamsia serinedens]|uniref:Enamine deaminase RidA, house cleaning of reactive enamine intermediates, YjgF/YER057c/UK114 family n=1 Tax=Williamsia serinedens TaxID=391736 RepID=A0ABT1GZI3_9NOCA|nr:RidA family protein [Williamsia serinedens]MCP2160134.1 Enamine deaminase RidA, house cleaning of reactive enamine intermediates, YjgF/YER057c/UK114 family [Williamsia serinedens]